MPMVLTSLECSSFISLQGYESMRERYVTHLHCLLTSLGLCTASNCSCCKQAHE